MSVIVGFIVRGVIGSVWLLANQFADPLILLFHLSPMTFFYFRILSGEQICFLLLVGEFTALLTQLFSELFDLL